MYIHLIFDRGVHPTILWEDGDQVADMKNTVKQQHKNNKKMGCNSSSSKKKPPYVTE